MSDAAASAFAARQTVALFVREDRGLISVRGTDARRWLNGMVSNDVAILDAAGPRSGCYALVLTRQGRIIADVLTIARPFDIFWIELSRDACEPTLQHLAKMVIADDVTLADESAVYACIQLEGPRSTDVMKDASFGADGAALEGCPGDAAVSVRIADADVVAVAHGESGEAAWRLIIPRTATGHVLARLREAGRGHGLFESDEATLDVLRVEAGTPRIGRELTPEVLPAEAGLDARAISFTKGCYTGQEIVARMRSRGSASHLLVGLTVAGGTLPGPHTPLAVDGRIVGELTSAVRSSEAGVIALGFVRRPHDAIGTRLDAAGISAVVCAIPFIAIATPGAA